ncbi:ABC transporter permease [Paenibacillus sp. FSL H3-0333]|uniref:ABC transporter permease n=2 Tax=Paenibacillus sp. FSL H3-0333 TaxID=2921373 RepID=UPI0030FB6483
MESVQKKGYVIHKLEAAPVYSVKPDKMQKEPVIIDEEAARRQMRRIIGIGRLSVALLIVLCWELFTRIGWMDSYYWSSPVRIMSTTWTQMTEGTLLEDIAYTSSSTILGFIGGTLIGSLLGLSFWWSRKFAGISEPFLILLNAMPKLALAPVLVILLGIGFFSKVALAFAMTVVVAALSAHSGVQSVDKDMEKLMYSLGAKRHQVFTKVVIPWAMPWMISSLRINIALSLAGAIVGEFIASSHGIGRMVIYAGTILDINLVWVGVVVLSALSMVMYAGVVLLEKWLSKGYGMKKA